MSAIDLRERYEDMLLESIQDTEFPSPAMLSRIEGFMTEPEAMERFIALLMQKAGGRYPSPTLLDRVDRLIRSLAQMEQQRARAEAG